jgi:uncharacterized protein YciI
VAYVLVTLHPTRDAAQRHSHQAAHERFIDSLIERHLVLLGGDFAAPVGGADAAYLLRCADLDEAWALSREDPLVREGLFEAEAVEWRLVGIEPEAIDPDLS